MPSSSPAKPSAPAAVNDPDTSQARAPTSNSSAPLRPPLDAELLFSRHRGQLVALFLSKPAQCAACKAQSTPLLLSHSINAAAPVAEVKPLFDHHARSRPVLALELPGFCASDCKRIDCTPQLMSDCLSCAAHDLHELGYQRTIDVMAVSLSCDFMARAALENPVACRRLALVSPTGFESRQPERCDSSRTKNKPWLR